MHSVAWTLLLSLLACNPVLASTPAKRDYSIYNYYVLEHNPAGVPLGEIANALNVEIVEPAGELLNHWLARADVTTEDVHARDSHQRDEVDRVIRTLQQLRDDERASRSARSVRSSIPSSVKFISRQQPRQRVKRAPLPIRQEDEVDETTRALAERLGIADPLFPKQWHLVNPDHPVNTMNVTGVWEMGITGKGVISAMVDDGLDYTSEDLKDNFYEEGSWDFNDHESLPTPKLSDDRHGTRCAGQIAAGKNNFCGVGIAYDSRIAGVRILSGEITDVDEASALNYDYQKTSIYSCSWGPPDNGKTMEGPSHLIKKAVVNGINRGRGGKGSIFVFASGNGASSGDQCNFDGYTNSIYSVTVSAVDHKGMHPSYSEACAANMIVAYSSGGGKHIVTTDKGVSKCTSSHGGTSAAAPNAAGVFALALQARPELSWRDIQHLCVRTARTINEDDPDWEMTAIGRPYSYKYGFGALDAWRFITAAKEWSLVKPQAWFETSAVQLNNGFMNSSGIMEGGEPISKEGFKSKTTITKEMVEANNFESLEHVRVRVWIKHTRRGDVEVEITSPSGIKSVLASKRGRDDDNSGYIGWTFMTVKHWGDNPVGDWTIRVSDQGSEGEGGFFLGWNMMFWGSVIDETKAVLYELPLLDDIFPPPEGPHDTDSSLPHVSATTKTHTKPTAILPSDHGEAEGENTKVAFPSATASHDASATPLSSESESSEESGNFVVQHWFLSLAAFAVIIAGAGAFMWRRAIRKRRENYSVLPDNEHAMSSMQVGGAGLPPSRENLHTIGEMSDDDADEETKLSTSGNAEKLQDDRADRYRDDPVKTESSSHASSEDALR